MKIFPKKQKSRVIAGAGIILACSLAQAQFSYPGCEDLKSTDFKRTEIFNKNGGTSSVFDNSLAEPVQMDMHGVRVNGVIDHVDIYFIQRLGAVKHYDGKTKKITSMGTIPVLGLTDDALNGIVLDPDFDKNSWIYFWYSPQKKLGDNRLLRLARITMTADHKLDMASEKIMMEILGTRSGNAVHSGGPMVFDSYGDLWITVGNNANDLNPGTCNVMSKTDSSNSSEWGSSNTASLRGGILRIHPDNSEKGYSIPAGNFGDYWAKQFESEGKTALAAEYRNPAKVLPENYVKGDRSNYSITVHPTKRWLAWGAVNYLQLQDEFNLVTHPIFAGYPYWHGNNAPTCDGTGKIVATPKNTSPLNSGVVDLPPAIPGVINSPYNVVISGPIYAYDQSLNSPTKFPPHLNQTWVQMSWAANQMDITTLDTNKVSVLKTQRVDDGLFKGLNMRNPLQAKYGPDGALYVLNYDGFYSSNNPMVFRLDYVGNCKLPLTTNVAKLRNPKVDVSFDQFTLAIKEGGDHEFRLYDIAGNLRGHWSGVGAQNYSLLNLGTQWNLEKGVYTMQVKTLKGIFHQSLSIL